jgi:cardiolipin synthase
MSEPTPEEALASAGLSPRLHQPAQKGPVALNVAGHQLTLFVETWPLVESMLRDLRRARRRIWLETYIFNDDAVGQAVAEALIERARAGVQVRVLYDAIGSQATPWAFFTALYEAGIEVHAFHTIWEALWKFSFLRVLNRRDHRKLLVIDDYHPGDPANGAVYFGGMNVVDASSAQAIEQAEHLPTSAGWRDLHVRMVGPQHGEAAESFDRSWRQAHGETIPRRPRAYRRAELAPSEESIQLFDCGPGLRHTRAARLFTRLIRRARRRLTFSMAYFLPVGGVLKALLRAPRRGVLVRIVVPGVSDVPLVQAATRRLYAVLLRRRCRIYERQVNMLHSKVMLMDDAWVVVGSCNLDARSLWINLEFLAVIHSKAFARVVRDVVAYEISHSARVTLQTYRQQSFWRRLLDAMAWLLRWWL